MLDKDLLKEAIEDCLSNERLHLYALNIFKRDNELILAVEIDESLDLDAIAEISEKISACLDLVDKSDEHYILDVSCAGIEREIKDEAMLIAAIGKYIHIDLKNKDNIEGDLEAIEDGILKLTYKDKNIVKKAFINKDDIKKIRFAIKF